MKNVAELRTRSKYRGFGKFHDSYDQYSDRQDKQGFITWEYHHHRVYGDIINPKLLQAVDDLAEKVEYKSRDNEFFLSGILSAPDGSRYGGEFTKKKAYYYNRKVKSRFGSEHIHNLVMSRMKQYLTESELLNDLIARAIEHKDFGLPKIKQHKEWLESEIKKLEQVSVNFSETVRNAAVSGDKNLANVVQALLEQKEKAESDLEQLRLELKVAKDEEINFKESLHGEQLKDYLKVVMAGFDSLHPLEQKQVLKRLIPQAVIHVGETESTLELFVDLAPKAALSHIGKGSKSAKIYKFPDRYCKHKHTLPLVAGAENTKGHFSYSAPSGRGEEKWPFAVSGRTGGI